VDDFWSEFFRIAYLLVASDYALKFIDRKWPGIHYNLATCFDFIGYGYSFACIFPCEDIQGCFHGLFKTKVKGQMVAAGGDYVCAFKLVTREAGLLQSFRDPGFDPVNQRSNIIQVATIEQPSQVQLHQDVDDRIIKPVFNTLSDYLQPFGLQGLSDFQGIDQAVVPVMESYGAHKGIEINRWALEILVPPQASQVACQTTVLILWNNNGSSFGPKHSYPYLLE
jgi:hypothetical protein